jgi:hypothetical protein
MVAVGDELLMQWLMQAPNNDEQASEKSIVLEAAGGERTKVVSVQTNFYERTALTGSGQCRSCFEKCSSNNYVDEMHPGAIVPNEVRSLAKSKPWVRCPHVC